MAVLFFFSGFYNEGICFNFTESSIRHLIYIVFLHQSVSAALGNRVQIFTDLRHHFHNADISAFWSEIFNDIKTYSAASDYNDFFAGAVFRIFSQAVDHAGDRSDFGAFLIDMVMQSLDRRKQRIGSGSVHNNIRVKRLDQRKCCFLSFKDKQVGKLGSAVYQVCRKVSQTFLSGILEISTDNPPSTSFSQIRKLYIPLRQLYRQLPVLRFLRQLQQHCKAYLLCAFYNHILS